MADDVQDATFEILKGIQASIVDLRQEMDRRFGQQKLEMTGRFDALTAESRTDRRNINGLMALLQAASGDFDQRIRDLDDRLSLVEDRAG